MILVTGAAGRLGQRVVQRLVDRGDDVVGTDARALDDTPSRFVQTDLCDTARVTDLVAQADAVIHMGAIPGPRQSEPYEIYRNNGQSTFNIIIATSERGLRRVVGVVYVDMRVVEQEFDDEHLPVAAGVH